MATIALSTTTSVMGRRSPETATPLTGRRRFGAALLAIGAGSALTSGIAAGTSAVAADMAPANLDAELLSLRSELMLAVAGVGYDENAPSWSDEEITRSSERLLDACWAVIDAPRALTPAGLALKAAAAMYELRYSYGCGGWGGAGEEMAWDFLSEIAGSVYVPPQIPARLLAAEEPGRA